MKKPKFLWPLLGAFIIAVVLLPFITKGQDVPPRFHGGITAEDETTFVDVLSDGANDRFASDALIKSRDPQNNLVEIRESGISDSNTTSTPLGSGGTFTGGWQDVVGYANVSVTIKSDQPSATDGLILEFSPDQSIVLTDDTYTIKANIGEIYTAGVQARYFRVRYINGGAAQGTFNLQTLLHKTKPKSSSHRIDDPIDGENDAELVKAVQTGKNANGSFVNRPAGGVVNVNSSSTLLGSGGTFTGSFVDLSGYGGFTIFVNTDQNGTLFVDSSTDGVNFTTEQFVVTGGMAFSNGFAPRTQFFRIRYTNGATAQTTFRLQTLLFTQQLSPSSQPINTNLNTTSIATNTRCVLAGQKENGTFSNTDLSNSGSVKVAVTDRPSEVRNRTLVQIPINRTALDAAPGNTVYTVTAGKTLYVSSFGFSQINDANNIGEWRLRDGTTVRATYLLGQRLTGAPSFNANASPSLPEPMSFSTSVNLVEITGDISVSGFLIGYEE